MKNKTPRVFALVLALVLGVTGFAYAWNRCGIAVKTASAWKVQAQKNGTWHHLMGIVNQHKAQFAFHPVDGDTVDSWFARQVIILPAAHAGTIPNTGCLGNQVGRLGDKSIPKGWPLVGALPSNLTTKDVKDHKTAFFNQRLTIKVTFVGQSTCINGTSRLDFEWVIGFVHHVHHHRPHRCRHGFHKKHGHCVRIHHRIPHGCSTCGHGPVCSAVNSPGATVQCGTCDQASPGNSNSNCTHSTCSVDEPSNGSGNGDTVCSPTPTPTPTSTPTVTPTSTPTATPTSTPTATPTPTPCAPNVGVPDVNDVEQGKPRTFTVVVDLCPGSTGTLTIHPHHGTIDNGNSVGDWVQSVSSDGDVSVTYRAPDEPNTTDVIDVMLDSDGQTVAKSTNTFNIDPHPGYPGVHMRPLGQ